MPMPKKFPTLLLVAAALLFNGPIVAASEERVTLEYRSDATVDILVTPARGTPRATAILFAGGTGRLRLAKGLPLKSRNFLVRSRNLFAEKGFLTITVDAPSDRQDDGLLDFRHSAEHMTDIKTVIAWARKRANIPVWLIGTSRGTVSAAHAGTMLDADGIVFSASVTRESRRRKAIIFDADLGKISAPVLIVHHKNDNCRVTPAEDVPELAQRLSGAKRVETFIFDGGREEHRNGCQATTHHGFLGIENMVVSAIAGWIMGINPGR